MDKSQDTGKTTDVMATGLWLDALKEAVQDRKKWCMLVEEKTRNSGRTNVK